MTPTFCLLLQSKWQNFTDLYWFFFTGLAKKALFSHYLIFHEVNQLISLYIWISSLLWECSVKCDIGHIAFLDFSWARHPKLSGWISLHMVCGTSLPFGACFKPEEIWPVPPPLPQTLFGGILGWFFPKLWGVGFGPFETFRFGFLCFWHL